MATPILRIGDAPGGNYEAKVCEMMLSGEIPSSGYTDVSVLHDDWCQIYQGRPCNCDPDVRVIRV